MKVTIATCLVLCAVILPAHSQTQSKEDEAIHNELRALRDGLVDAINKGDIERQLTFLHPNVVVTWQNAEISRGREGVRAYLNRMLSGPDKVVDSYSTELNVDELTILHGGDTGISFGSAVEHFKLANGSNLDNPSRWTTTAVREGDEWLIASVHASSNLFDNPVLTIAKRATYVAAGICLVVGLVIGFLLGKRKRPA